MIFTELRFLLLFAGCLATFHLLPRRFRPAVLAIWGAAFYFLYAGWFLVAVLVLTALTLVAGNRLVAWLTGLATVALLVWFKVLALAPAVPGAVVSTASVLVPLGFSYLSFELLHVIIERRRGRIAQLRPLELLAFVFFAPARIAGPIKRYPAFIAAVQEAELSAANVYAGLLRVLSGLAKKFFLADVLALTAPEALYVGSARHAWTIVLAYSLQIYFDFSAYSDIAIGLARMMGIRLPENFRWPYLAPNIREFWERWHITLSQWVRDYIFMPTGRLLFGTPLRPWPIAIAAISYLVTFATVGLWHGLTPAFLVWGLYHGVLLTSFHVIRLKLPRRVVEHPWYASRGVRVLATVTTFLLVTIGWVPFMMPLPEAMKMLTMMFGGAR